MPTLALPVKVWEVAERVYRGYKIRVVRRDVGTGCYDRTHAMAFPDPHGCVLVEHAAIYGGALSLVLDWMETEVDRCLAEGICYR